MKYIRTKERGENSLPIILEIERYYHNEICYCGIEKTAYTIEELCDEFVFHDKKYGCRYFISIDFSTLEYVCTLDCDEYTKPTKITSEDEIYGAIWTNKGLIYVAKMNEKGELELI